MSFNSDIKDELLSLEIENDCCMLAQICACINTIGSLEINKQGISFSVLTENVGILTQLQKSIKTLYANKIDLENSETKIIGKHTFFELSIPKAIGNMILKDCGILQLDETNNYTIKQGIDHHIIMSDCCKRTYIKTVFLTSGIISIPSSEEGDLQKNSGYHFEIEFTNNEQAKSVASLLGEFGFIVRKVDRQSKAVVYMKEGETIADFLGFVGATKSFLKLQNKIVERDMRNNINRQSNCISANINKAITASLGQLQAIEIIESTIGLDSLPDNIKKYALLRKENPDASLAELIELSNEKISKAGMNYKLKKIVEISKNLQ